MLEISRVTGHTPDNRDGLQDAPPGARCAIHSETLATVVCNRCGNYCCAQCGAQVFSRYLCLACFEIEKPMLHGGDATQTQRLVNFMVDGACARLPGSLLTTLASPFGVRAVFANVLLGVVLSLSYYVALESMFGISLGKLVTRTKVVAESGDRASLQQIIIRSLCRFVPFEPFSFFGQSRGWHDRWSGTRVVRRLPPRA